MSTHNIKPKAILMSTHNICFYGELTKIILLLSSNTLLMYFFLGRTVDIEEAMLCEYLALKNMSLRNGGMNNSVNNSSHRLTVYRIINDHLSLLIYFFLRLMFQKFVQ